MLPVAMATTNRETRRVFKRTKRARQFVAAVGFNIRTARNAAGMSQGALGRKVGTDAPTVSRIESGKKDLRLSELFEVAMVLEALPASLVSVEIPANGKR